MTRIAAVQLAPRVGDLEGNVQRASEAIRQVLDEGADIIVLPELATSGYVFASVDEARQAAVRPDHPLFAAWAALLASRPGAVLVTGFAELADDGLHNSAAVVTADGVAAVYRKVHLWDREKEVFRPGNTAPPVVETAHGRIGAMVCFDLEFPEWTRMAALAGADLLAVPTNWPLGPRPAGERVAEVLIAMATARMNHVAIAFADRTGSERGVDWSEGTGIVGADGWLRDAVGAGTGTAWADLDLLDSRDKGQTELVDLFADRRPDLYHGLGVAPAVARSGGPD